MVTTAMLDFEEPIAVLLAEISALTLLPRTAARHQEIERLRTRVKTLRQEIFAGLTPAQRMQVARHPDRPRMLDYVERLCDDFIEIHGDRRSGDDPAVVAGLARIDDRPVLVVGHEKGRGATAAARRHGAARPDGYRKALRAMRLAEKTGRPIVTFVDTPAAQAAVDAEARGSAEAIAMNIREMSMLAVPILVALIGEGGGAGALGLGVGDRVLMQEYATYSVVPPETCATILWGDSARLDDAATALRITASDLVSLGVVDEAVAEPMGGAHADPDDAARRLGVAIRSGLATLGQAGQSVRLHDRHQRLRQLGQIGLADPATT